jgi:nicotinamidase-related amidase
MSPLRETLSLERAALVIVDLQEKLLPAMRESERVLAASRTLLHLARVLELPVLLTTQYRKGLGPLVAGVSELAPDVEAIDKVAFGCFGSDAFRERLAALRGRDQLVVAGIESHICVTQTVLGALEAGYAVHAVSDAIDSRSEANWRLGLQRMERAGALVSSVEMASYELLARADSAAFKQMLPHFK